MHHTTQCFSLFVSNGQQKDIVTETVGDVHYRPPSAANPFYGASSSSGYSRVATAAPSAASRGII